MTDERGVTWGRYDAEHRALLDRVDVLEERAEALRDAESIHADIQNRLTDLEHLAREAASRGRGRRDRLWLVALTVMSGIVAPLVVTALITWAHLRGSH